MQEKLNTLVKKLNALGLRSELGDTPTGDPSEYLIRMICLVDDPGEENLDLVVMGDLGVTYEPSGPTTTPRYCTINLDNLGETADKLIRLAKTRREGKLGNDSQMV